MLRSCMPALVAVYHWLISALAVLAAILLILMTFGIGAEAFMRSLGLGLVYGIVDFSEHSMFNIAMLPAPWIMAHNGHISVDLLKTNVSQATARAIGIAADLVGLVLCAVVAVYGAGILVQSYTRGEYIFQELVIPEWWLQWQVPLVFLLLTVEFALRLLNGGQPSTHLHTAA